MLEECRSQWSGYMFLLKTPPYLHIKKNIQTCLHPESTRKYNFLTVNVFSLCFGILMAYFFPLCILKAIWIYTNLYYYSSIWISVKGLGTVINVLYSLDGPRSSYLNFHQSHVFYALSQPPPSVYTTYVIATFLIAFVLFSFSLVFFLVLGIELKYLNARPVP